MLVKVISKSPFDTLSPILTFTFSITPSKVEGTSTLDLSLSRVTTESFFFILSPGFTRISTGLHYGIQFRGLSHTQMVRGVPVSS